MVLLSTLRCAIGRHAPTPHRVSWDGANYCGTCTGCGERIRRIRRGRWRLDEDP